MAGSFFTLSFPSLFPSFLPIFHLVIRCPFFLPLSLLSSFFPFIASALTPFHPTLRLSFHSYHPCFLLSFLLPPSLLSSFIPEIRLASFHLSILPTILSSPPSIFPYPSSFLTLSHSNHPCFPSHFAFFLPLFFAAYLPFGPRPAILLPTLPFHTIFLVQLVPNLDSSALKKVIRVNRIYSWPAVYMKRRRVLETEVLRRWETRRLRLSL